MGCCHLLKFLYCHICDKEKWRSICKI
jgi:hypothetical protein